MGLILKSKPIIIAVDGPAASGKGTLARKLAAHFGYAYLDTGALYRAVGLGILQAGTNPSDDEAALKAAQNLDMNWLQQADTQTALRTAEAGRAASLVAAKPQVRAAILGHQRQFAAHPPGGVSGGVLDGRDIGTVVCRDAAHKLFVTARPEIRAERRWQELVASGSQQNLDSVLADIQQRDAHDTNRTTAPLKQADNAHLLDTSDLSIEEAFAAALALIK